MLEERRMHALLVQSHAIVTRGANDPIALALLRKACDLVRNVGIANQVELERRVFWQSGQ
jgi:hypothetical protein